ncbi:MAG: epimerase [Planctomycetes bacterium RBG_16_64_12]|nr:MAG: epimerase [Planctomycetes bacterium RBG_16_64_12]
MNLPENELQKLESIADVEQLEELLSRPTAEVIDTMGRLEGDLLVLGACGKIGPTLARMARRASDEADNSRRVIAVDKLVPPKMRKRFESQGIELICADLLERKDLDALPEVPNVVYMAAMKFGSSGREETTWAMNTHLAGLVCERFWRSRIVAYSTGNVYKMVPVDSGGAKEGDPLGPIGEYAMSCLGRERMVTYFSRTLDIPAALIRLNYANELRYGVLTDIVLKVLAGEPIDLVTGHFNAIWQGDANAMLLRALEHVATPPLVVNVAGPDTLSVRRVAEEFSQLLDKPVTFTGSESPDALLSNGQRGHKLLGHPRVGREQMIRWVADWHRRGGPTLGKPTKFQVRDGEF